MDTNCMKQENDDHYNMYGIRKITYWEKYGVKRFSYPGQHRYSPLVYQSFDGGIVISNDVFGLTIKQFEQTYKSCLYRRNTQQQRILNLRYPDKSTNEYLEYLQNCTDCKKDDLIWPGNGVNENYIYEHLVNIVGTEIDIRTRQRLFVIKDMIENTGNTDITQISSGSLAEGLDLPGSDVDLMFVINNVNVVRNTQNLKRQLQHTTLFMETDTSHPGFTRLRMLAEVHGEINFITSECYEHVGRFKEVAYLSATRFLDNITSKFQLYPHGPCLSDMNQDVDIALCFKSKKIPDQAIPWSFRRRHQWPPCNVIDNISNYGCLLVPIGPKTFPNDQLLWRLSFSVAEKKLVHSFNFTQLLCYGLLKLTLRRIICTNNEVKDLMCSYFLKTALFWVSEEVDIDTFQLPKLFTCFFLCVNKLISWVSSCYCPNYFIPEHNMFKGKITADNNETLLHVLDNILFYGIDELILNSSTSEKRKKHFLGTNIELSYIRLDFLVYRICTLTMLENILFCYKGLRLIESLIKSESSTLISEVCKFYFAKMSQYAAQILPPLTTKDVTYFLQKMYHKHLQNGIEADAVSGWLLYSSFYYMTGQYKVTLKLTDYVLSRSSPDMLYVGCRTHKERDKNNYKQLVHNSVTLNDRMKIATVSLTTYTEHSPLFPVELQGEYSNGTLSMSPVAMSHCLRFLCYHHLGDIFNRRNALRDLHFTVKNSPFTKLGGDLSDSLTVLGICYEISGDSNAAYESYKEALKCDYQPCPSAETRKSKLTDV